MSVSLLALPWQVLSGECTRRHPGKARPRGALVRVAPWSAGIRSTATGWAGHATSERGTTRQTRKQSRWMATPCFPWSKTKRTITHGRQTRACRRRTSWDRQARPASHLCDVVDGSHGGEGQHAQPPAGEEAHHDSPTEQNSVAEEVPEHVRARCHLLTPTHASDSRSARLTPRPTLRERLAWLPAHRLLPRRLRLRDPTPNPD